MWNRLYLWTLRRLIGRRPVMANIRLVNGVVELDVHQQGGLIVNNAFIGTPGWTG
jgi:hypothetical protein